MSNSTTIGTVWLVGAGPGDPGLMTLKGAHVLQLADVVVYDRLIGDELLEMCRPDAQKIFVGKEAGRHALPQDEINGLLVACALEGKSVCRLKGGDPFVFGRGGEEALACREADVPFEIISGVSSSIAAPAYAGIPITQRGVAASFAVVTGHTREDEAPPERLPVADTLVFLMGVRALPVIVKQLIERGDSPDTPIALIRWGTTVEQQVVSGTLHSIEDDVRRAGLKPPALIVVGEVVRLREKLQWFDNRPLWGQTVVVTRAREQASTLVEALKDCGARIVQCPSIRVEAIESHIELDKIINDLRSFHWVVFTSSNGVEKLWSRMRDLGLDARAFGRIEIAAIGPATAEALARIGLSADFIPESSVSEDVAQGLIALGVSNKEVLIARAKQGRGVLEASLTEAGAKVTTAICYHTVPDTANASRVKAMLADGEIDWITFSSSSTVGNFMDAVGCSEVTAARASFKVACIGPVTARTAQEYGLTPDVVAEETTVAGIVDAIKLAVDPRHNRTI